MISQAQVTALTAQAALAATYNAYDDVGNLLPDWYLNDLNVPVYLGADVSTRGIGIYGQSPENLVLVELLKPSALSLLVDPDLTLIVLNTPAMWTGLYNINSLTDYLNTPAIQNLAQLALYEGAYYGLIDTGIITGTESSRFIATFLQPAVKYGVTAVAEWVREGNTDTNLSTMIQIAARQGQYAIDFVDTYGSVLNVAPELGGYDNTVVRDQVDQAVTDIIGNQKIPDIEYANVGNITVGNVAVTIPGTTLEDGTLRFAPGSTQG